MKNKSFLNGALILGVAGIVSRSIGFFFKVPLTTLIGATGLGLYSYPFNLYTAMLAISITGLPVAISKMVSERLALKKYQAVAKVFKVSLIMMSIMGLITSLLLLLGTKVIVNRFWPEDTYYSLLALVFAPFFVSLMSVFRGYFQGMQSMVPTAMSQVYEAIGRVIVGLGLAYMLVSKGIPLAAGGASFGATAGSIFGLIYLFFTYIKSRPSFDRLLTDPSGNQECESSMSIVKTILSISIPISIGAVASSLMSLIDSLMINSRLLSAGFSNHEATALYGQLGGANTLINVPLAISIAIAASIVPAISKANVHKNHEEIKNRLEESIRMGVLVGLPATMGLFILANPIMNLVFKRLNGGGDTLQYLCLALVFIILNQIFTGALQGIGKIMTPVKHLFVGSVLKILISYFLVSQPFFNVKGAALGTLSGYILASFLNYRSVKKSMGVKINVKHLMKPIFSVVIMSIGVYYGFLFSMNMFHSNTIATLLAIFIGVVSYPCALVLSGEMNMHTLLNMLPLKRKK